MFTVCFVAKKEINFIKKLIKKKENQTLVKLFS